MRLRSLNKAVLALGVTWLCSCGGVRSDAVVEPTTEGALISWTGDPIARLHLERSNYDDDRGEDVWGVECDGRPCIESPVEVGVTPPGATETTAMEGPLGSGEYIVWMWSDNSETAGPPAAFHFSYESDAEEAAPHPIVLLLQEFFSRTQQTR